MSPTVEYDSGLFNRSDIPVGIDFWQSTGEVRSVAECLGISSKRLVIRSHPYKPIEVYVLEHGVDNPIRLITKSAAKWCNRPEVVASAGRRSVGPWVGGDLGWTVNMRAVSVRQGGKDIDGVNTTIEPYVLSGGVGDLDRLNIIPFRNVWVMENNKLKLLEGLAEGTAHIITVEHDPLDEPKVPCLIAVSGSTFQKRGVVVLRIQDLWQPDIVAQLREIGVGRILF